jgi:hypothetical protein
MKRSARLHREDVISLTQRRAEPHGNVPTAWRTVSPPTTPDGEGKPGITTMGGILAFRSGLRPHAGRNRRVRTHSHGGDRAGGLQAEADSPITCPSASLLKFQRPNGIRISPAGEGRLGPTRHHPGETGYSLLCREVSRSRLPRHIRPVHGRLANRHFRVVPRRGRYRPCRR